MSPHELFLVLFSLLMVSSFSRLFAAGEEPQVPCYFIFGDSLADNGNNNNLATRAKVNFRPYGIDFPSGPTGRFSNGRTAFDIIAELLGFKCSIPPFRTAIGNDILKGVNYASGSAGIRQESGSQLGAHFGFDLQLLHHQVIIKRIAKILGNEVEAQKYLNKCLYSVSIGSNDYINNYFMPQFYSTRKTYTPEQFATVLIDQYSKQLQSLHASGARKFALFGLGSLGCTPNAIDTYGTNGSVCVDKMNEAATIFNGKLVPLVDRLNNELTDSKFVYVNGTSVTFSGFTVLNKGCCLVGSTGLCVPNGTPCPNRTEYLFWDSFHMTDAANEIVARNAYNALLPIEANPIDLSVASSG